jgi:DNA-binding response OmpR family regulator
MATIVVCEDDASTRALITAVLSKEGHRVEAFGDGLKGFARLCEGGVDLLISDVQMPSKDGFALVAQVREDPEIFRLPCILLTSLGERSHMRTGMTSGADDYVTKPFQHDELLDSVNIQLMRAMQIHQFHVDETQRTLKAALGERTIELMEMFEKRLMRELQTRWQRSDTSSTQLRGSLLACAIVGQEKWQTLLSNTQLADLARHFFNKVADSATVFGVDFLQFVGDGLLLAFDQVKDQPSLDHLGRAMKLIQAMGAIRRSMQMHVQELQQSIGTAADSNQSWPKFEFCIVLHPGELGLGKLEGITGGIEQLVPVGQDVQLMSKLLQAAQALRWSVLLSENARTALSQRMPALSILEHADVKIGGQVQRVQRVG